MVERQDRNVAEEDTTTLVMNGDEVVMKET